MLNRDCVLILIITSAILTGCNLKTANNNAINTCPNQPTGTLDQTNVKSISLSGQESIQSGQINSNQNQGYIFTAKTGQKLAWQTKENLCVWIFTPSNKLLKSNDLPENGKYTIQLSLLNGATSFNLAMKLEDEFESLTSSNSPQEEKVNFNRSDYPKSQCGDALPNDPKAYPINFYPVEVPYNISNLNQIRNSFCRDALKKGGTKIQVASFTSIGKAKEFAEFVDLEIKGAMVGTPTTIQSSQEQVTEISSSLPEQALIDYYANINNRNYQETWQLLSSEYKERKSISYSSYTNWWDTVNVVKINNIRINSRENNQADIYGQLQYLTKDGKIMTQDTRFILVWRADLNRWILEDVRRIQDDY